MKKTQSMRKIKLLALDLDGTTLYDDNTIGPRTKAAIEAAIAAGIIVVAASGRPLSTMPECVMNIKGLDYSITSNGAAICKNSSCLRRSLIDPDDVLKILNVVRDFNVILEGFINGEAYADVRYVHRPMDYGCSPAYFEYTRSCRGKVADMPTFLSKHRFELDLIGVVSCDERVRRKIRAEAARAANNVEVTSSAENFVEFMSAEATKAKALARLCGRLNIDMKNVCACGNADNDAEMIREAGLGAAVKNASRSCLERADIVVASNNDDGVAELIERITNSKR